MADFSDSTFEEQVLKSDKPVLVDFWAPWCGPCKMVSPIIEELSEEYKGKVVVGKVNVDENLQVTEQFGIMSLPSVVLFKNGQPVKTLIGAQQKASYKSAIEEILAA